MLEKKTLHLFLILSALFLSASCAEPEGVSETGTQVVTVMYPHADGWEAYSSHGQDVLDNGRTRCAYCHGSGYTGNGAAASSCFSCHTIYPHASDWRDITIHGEYALNYGVADSCATNCHGSDYAGTVQIDSCFSCHAVYPHTAFMADWETYAVHGGYVQTNGTASCVTACHGSDLAGGESGIACSTCHQYPHADGWVLSHSSYGGQGVVNIDASCQTTEGCHNVASKGTANPGLACTEFCHQ